MDFKQLDKFYKFYPINPIYLSEKTPYLAKTFNSSIQT